MRPVAGEALATLFGEARTFTRWQDRPVPEGVVERALGLAQLGPTSANCQPMRLVLVRSAMAKERLLPCVSSGNFEKVRTAPVTAIVAYDREFYDYLPRLYRIPTRAAGSRPTKRWRSRPPFATAHCKALT